LSHPTVRCPRKEKINPAAVIKFSDSVDADDEWRVRTKAEVLSACPNLGEVGESGRCHGDADFAVRRDRSVELAVHRGLAKFEYDGGLHLRSPSAVMELVTST
jgi:hypothetical protein